MTDEVKYEVETVKTLRGTERSAISRREQDGWELVSQDTGTLLTTLTFRRPKKPVPRLLIVAGAGVAVVLVAAIAIGAALEDPDNNTAVEAGPAATGAANGTTAASQSPSPAQAEPSEAVPVTSRAPAATVLTTKNSPDLAKLLKTDPCGIENVDFAAEYAGRTISFNGSIRDKASFSDDTTRFDLLIGPGNKGPKTTIGPNLKYEDVNVRDLNLTGDPIPSAVGEGDRFRFVATVGEFNVVQCVFRLQPVSTQLR